MLVRPLTRPLVAVLADPLRENALPWDEGVRGGGAAGWTPLQLTNLRLWIDASNVTNTRNAIRLIGSAAGDFHYAVVDE